MRGVSDIVNKEKNLEWISVDEKLPEPNIIVRVLLTNDIEALDFVNEPIDSDVPFQHYLVSSWRMPTREELCEFIQKANCSR